MNSRVAVLKGVEAVTTVGGAQVVQSTWVLDRSMPLTLAAVGDRRGGDRALVPGPGKVELHITPYDPAGNEGDARRFVVDLSAREYWGRTVTTPTDQTP